ncbi:HutD family protein [Tissierella sp.]|uniref:HutD family protein n=1 Tax=Tissierella sp. TaxID=41274 RepID=UPI002856D2B6|nr:HutD family protein [Tissierella sp.]MDR7856620.1 HutD family protein [Tissierella sp.]
MIIIKEDEFITSEWSGGKTTEMFIYPKDSNYKSMDFKCRISSATVELEESEFTKLKEVNRFITPLNKELRLTHDLQKYIELKPYEIYEFDGEMSTYSIGKVIDFNLMLANGAKGYLINERVKEESIIKILPTNVNYQEEFEIFYSHEMSISFIADDKEIILNPNELLVISISNKDIELDIKIKSKTPCNLLRTRIMIP